MAATDNDLNLSLLDTCIWTAN